MLLLLFVCNTISESSKSCLWGYFFLLILVPLPVPFMLSLISLAIPVSTHSRTVGKEAAPGFLCSVLYCLRVHTLTVHIDRKDFLQRNTAWPSPCQDVVGGLDSGEQWEPVHLPGAVPISRTDWRLELVWLPWWVHFSERLGWGEVSKIHMNFTFLGQFTQFFEEEA